MKEYNLGRVAFVDKGAYSPTVTYNKWDFVTTSDSTYLYINDTPKAGTSVTDTNYWKCLADGKPATTAATNANTVATNVANAEAQRVANGSEVKTNKTSDIASNLTSTDKYPSTKGVNDFVQNNVIEQVRSQNINKVPSSKLFDDKLTYLESKISLHESNAMLQYPILVDGDDNVINPLDWTIGGFAHWSWSPMYAVIPGTIYYFGNIGFKYLYDSNGTIVNTITWESGTACPDGIYFIKFGVQNLTSYSEVKAFLSKSTNYYEKFGKKFNDSLIRLEKSQTIIDIDTRLSLHESNAMVQYPILIDGINLINPYECTLNEYIMGDGSISKVTGWYHTPKYQVKVGTIYSFMSYGEIRLYDSNGTIVTTITWESGTACPDGISYIQFTGGNNTVTDYTQIKDFLAVGNYTKRIPFAKTINPYLINIQNRPFLNKKIFFVGDSITMLGLYFEKLLNITGLNYVGSTGTMGNGMTLTGFANMITNFSTQIAQADFISIFGGTNDYGHGSATLGSYDDISGSNTIYGAVKSIIDSIYAIKKDIQIIFFSEPERGTFLNDPSGVIPPDPNYYGLTLWNISKAIEDCCSRKGIAFCDIHKNAWTMDQLSIFTNDNLHPNQRGADKIGELMGNFINQL